MSTASSALATMNGLRADLVDADPFYGPSSDSPSYVYVTPEVVRKFKAALGWSYSSYIVHHIGASETPEVSLVVHVLEGTISCDPHPIARLKRLCWSEQ